MIANRIRQARLGAGLTLAALGDRVGVTHTTIQKYEKGLTAPSSSQLLKIAEACGVRVEYFFRIHHVELVDLEFRKLATFGKAAQDALAIRVREMIERRVELLGMFPESPLYEFRLPSGLPKQITTLQQLEAVAMKVRDAWRLGLAPIADLTDTLETLGLLVVVVDELHTGFSGMTATACTADGRAYPVIAVSSQWPGDRQRFTLAHELGHLLLAGRVDAALDEEIACDRFAGAFLAPQANVVLALGGRRRGIAWRELLVLKREFGLSMAVWLQRAKQCDVISDSVHAALRKEFSSRGWRRAEPGEPYPGEKARLFERLVYRALGEGYVSESKAAELLAMPVTRFQQQRQLRCLI